MTDENESDNNYPPAERATQADQQPAADAFAALSDPLRLDIIQALAAHNRATPETPTVKFSTLRKAVGGVDSGRFRYHLNELRGSFVEKAVDGYQLTYAGEKIVAALIAGTYTDRTEVPGLELDSECPVCASTARARYDDGVLSVDCEDGHPLFGWTLAPNAATDADLAALVSLATTLAYHSYELVTSGTCSECFSVVDRSIRTVDETAAGQQYRFAAVCTGCGAQWNVPVGFALLGHPQIEALYGRLGRPIREGYWWECEFVTGAISTERLSTDPLRIELSADHPSGGFRATVDGQGLVVEVDCWDGEPDVSAADADS